MTKWWESIPHVDDARWEICGIHSLEFGDQMWRTAPDALARVEAYPVFAAKLRESLRYIKVRATSPGEWAEWTHTYFFSHAELHTYLDRYYAYLFEGGPVPDEPPDNERNVPDEVNWDDRGSRNPDGEERE